MPYKPSPPTDKQAKAKGVMYPCGIEGCEFEHYRSQTVGVHRRAVHGIISDRPDAVAKRKYFAAKNSTPVTESEAPKKLSRKAVVKYAEVVHPEVATQDNRLEVLAAYTVGRIDQLIQGIALEHDCVPKQLAARCLEHLRSATGR